MTERGVAASYQALLAVMAALHECSTLTELEATLTRRVTEIVAADLVSLNRIDLTGDLGGSTALLEPPFVSPKEIESAFDRYLPQHPLVAEFVRTGDGRPRRMSDYIDTDEFQRLDLYRHVFRPLRSLHQIAFSVTAVPGMVVGIGVNRTHDDFTDDELHLTQLLYDQLPAALHHVRLREVHERERKSIPLADLSDREREVLLHLRAGLGNQEIAAALQLGRRTIEKHLERLYAKLGVRTRTAAVHAVWNERAAG